MITFGPLASKIIIGIWVADGVLILWFLYMVLWEFRGRR